MINKKINIWFCIGLTIAALSGCRRSVTNNLINKVKYCDKHSNQGCKIDLNEVTGFTWDKMYLFGDWTNTDSITNAIKFNYQGSDVPDDYTRMLFTYQNKVVYEEDFKALFYNNSTLEFEGAIDSFEKSRPYQLNAPNATFFLKKSKINGTCAACFAYTLAR